jgi:hypothetical protein
MWSERLFPNRFVYSRDQNAASAPYIEVELGPADNQAPKVVGNLRALPEGRVTWTSPADVGAAGVVGYQVTVDGRDVPQYLIPGPEALGALTEMDLRSLNLPPGHAARLEVRAVDGAGNIGHPATCTATEPQRPAAPKLGPLSPIASDRVPLPNIAGAEVAVIDELDKYDPQSRKLIPEQDSSYLASNHLWSAKTREIRLDAARGETVSFQLLIRNAFKGLSVEPTNFPGGNDAKPVTTLGLYTDVQTKSGRLPDPIVPLGAGDTLDSDPDHSTSIHVELSIPHSSPSQVYKTQLRIKSAQETLTLPIMLKVWDFSIPDTLTFLPEMNCYDLPANERDYYRLAHRHRTVLNRVPYYHRGQVADGCAPLWDGKTLDFREWDRRFAPLFEASAFEGLPRAGVPIECFYLPLFENWPVAIEPHYNGDYWADRAFDPAYRAAFVEATRQFAEHVEQRGWKRTMFQFYLNGKNDFKRNGWSRSTSPWLLDEPANFQDFWALRFFGSAFHEGVRQARGGRDVVLPFVFRADISRPQWQRQSLDGLLDYAVVGGAFRQYRPLVLDRARREHQLVIEYGSTNPIEASNLQPVAWSIDSWSLGADGVLPWQTVGTSDSWTRGDELSLFYPARSPAEGVVPSVRLKAYRRGQQDVEYLNLLAGLLDINRTDRRQLLDGIGTIDGTRRGTGDSGGEDAGRIDYDRLRPQDLWAWRTRVAQFIEKNRQRHPAAKTDPLLLNPQRNPATLGGFIVGE